MQDFNDTNMLFKQQSEVLPNLDTQEMQYCQYNHKKPTSKTAENSLHILLVTETWLPDINGVAMSLNNIMSALVKMGHKISLIRPKAKFVPTLSDHNKTQQHRTANVPLQNDIEVKGIPIPRYKELQLGIASSKQIKKILAKIKPDIVHIATEGPLGLSALKAAKKCNLPVTTGYHTQFHDFSKHLGMGIIASPLMAYFKYLHNASLATCVPSPKTQDDLTKLGFKRIYQVGRGVDTTGFNPNKSSDALRKQWGVASQDTVLVMVSRLSPEKGVDIVIKGFNKLQRQQLHRGAKLVIVGDGPDTTRLKTMAKGNDDIIFAGMQRGEDLAKHYASGDVFVFASQVETFGNVVTEAMASGLGVYAFDDAAAGMLVDDSCGGLVAVNQTDDFIKMVTNLPKLQKLRQQGEQARKKVEQLSWGHPAKQMLTMFNDAIKHNNAIN